MKNINVFVLIGTKVCRAKVIRVPYMSGRQGISLVNTCVPLAGNFEENRGSVMCVLTRKGGVPLLVPHEKEGHVVLFKVEDNKYLAHPESGKKVKPFCTVMGWEIYNLEESLFKRMLKSSEEKEVKEEGVSEAEAEAK